ncbi:MAG: ABC transporter ATP-binding protein [Candidatus Brocadiia bacterium]
MTQQTPQQPTYDIEARELRKSFGDHEVLRGVDLQVAKGTTCVLVGPSGCGKSVFLKHIVALLTPDSGEMTVLGKNIAELPPLELLALRRNVGMVFQSSALLNSLTVEENVALGLAEFKEKPPEEIRQIVNEKLALVEMADTNRLLPEELSGGMRKRVAVARTLALGPKIILFDEPTVGLDPLLSTNVDNLILDLKEKVGCTNVVVTHDLITAFRVADRIGMFHDGIITALGTPEEFGHSKEPVVQEFIARNRDWKI